MDQEDFRIWGKKTNFLIRLRFGHCFFQDTLIGYLLSARHSRLLQGTTALSEAWPGATRPAGKTRRVLGSF